MNERREQLVITFTLGGERFAIPIHRVQEIIRLVAVTRLPRLPELFEGVINLRGRVIPVVDLRKQLGDSECLPTRQARIIIVEVGGQFLGFIVDTVADVELLDAHRVEPPPAFSPGLEAGLIGGVVKAKGALFAILDLEKLLTAEQLSAARTAGGGVAAPD